MHSFKIPTSGVGQRRSLHTAVKVNKKNSFKIPTSYVGVVDF